METLLWIDLFGFRCRLLGRQRVRLTTLPGTSCWAIPCPSQKFLLRLCVLQTLSPALFVYLLYAQGRTCTKYQKKRVVFRGRKISEHGFLSFICAAQNIRILLHCSCRFSFPTHQHDRAKFFQSVPKNAVLVRL